MVTAALIGGLAATVLLLARALVGDRSRGRRRCPRCWYDMSATEGLTCPECGRDAGREGRLFKARRRKRWIAASLVPLAVGVVVYGVAVFNDPAWPRRVPTTALIALSPWNDARTRLGNEYAERVHAGSLAQWQQSLAAGVSRGVARGGGDGKLVLYHVSMLFTLSRTDASLMADVVAVASDPDPTAVAQAAAFIEALAIKYPGEAGAGEDALTKLTEHPSRQVKSVAINSLLGVKSRRPGGRAPALALADAENGAAPLQRAYACGLLGLYDPSDESRRVLLAAANSTASATDTEQWVRVRAVCSLTRLAPDDVKVRELLIATLRDPAMANTHARLISWVIDADRWSVDPSGELTAPRRNLYSDDVRAAMLAAERAPTPGPIALPVPGVPPPPTVPRNDAWERARGVLRTHPCFTEAERGAIRSSK